VGVVMNHGFCVCSGALWPLPSFPARRSSDLATLEYRGTGTIEVDGEPCALTSYRASTNYQTFSQRIQYTCTRPSGETYSNIEVRSEEHTSELQSRENIVCRLLLEKKKNHRF